MAKSKIRIVQLAVTKDEFIVLKHLLEQADPSWGEPLKDIEVHYNDDMDAADASGPALDALRERFDALKWRHLPEPTGLESIVALMGAVRK